MSVPLEAKDPAVNDSTDKPEYRTRRSTRLPIVIVMIASLLVSGIARFFADQSRHDAIPMQGGEVSTSASLGGMDSFAMGLLLGGLRGPLVMMLWTQSESQKSDKDLEGVDTQIEWIRLLQPEFDTVHIFQIWNKAYNISVQMASMANKYTVILSAMDYANDVNRAKPEDINIVAAVAQLYFDKLGMSSEKYYYRRRVRMETLPSTDSVKPHSTGARRTRFDPILDASYNVIEPLIKPAPGRRSSTSLSTADEYDDGSDLQYLPLFGPYPDGVSTFGLAFNYYKRAEVLQNKMKQHHDQLSDLVVDSRPGLCLKQWGEDELDQARRREIQAFGAAMPDDVDSYLKVTTSIKSDQAVVHQSDLYVHSDGTRPDATYVSGEHELQMALADYGKAIKVLPTSLDEYNRHILNFPERESQYRNYMEDIRTEIELANGDYEYLTAMVCPPAERADHLTRAASYYRECRHLSYLMLLRYYIDSGLVKQSLPPGYTLQNNGTDRPIESLSLEEAVDVVSKATELKRQSKNVYVNTDRYEFDRYIDHCNTREAAIAQSATTVPAQ